MRRTGQKRRRTGQREGNPADLTTTERRGRREVEQPKVGPKGKPSGNERVKEHGGHGGKVWTKLTELTEFR